MKLKLILPMIAVAVILPACSQSVPKCGSSDVTKLVTEIADREMTTQLGEEAAKVFTYAVETIRTTNTNETTGSHKCAADLKIIGNNGKDNSIPITYTVENTDDGKNIYVNVFGL